ncbi:MAG TPA: alpha/beta hydrolase [Isosphaeraceae bacterium]|nr:alpha/beta hydrolase [Isosphaeraceae bacterium]
MRVARLPAVVYLGFLGVLYSLQTRIIFPGQETQGQPFAEVRPRPGTELIRLQTHRGESIVALYGPALTPSGQPHPQAADRPTLIYFYGNAMCLSYARSEFDQFRRLGLNVLIPEYVGFGMSSGSASEKGCQATADAAYDELVSHRGVKPARIVAGGWSLGGAVAVDLAARKPVGGLIIFSTFTSAVDMARRLLPMMPVSLLLRHRFETLHKIGRVECPVLVGHGRLDRIVPFAMGQRLAAAAKGPVTTLWIDQADHNDFYEIGGRRIDDAVTRFIDPFVSSR